MATWNSSSRPLAYWCAKFDVSISISIIDKDRTMEDRDKANDKKKIQINPQTRTRHTERAFRFYCFITKKRPKDSSSTIPRYAASPASPPHEISWIPNNDVNDAWWSTSDIHAGYNTVPCTPDFGLKISRKWSSRTPSPSPPRTHHHTTQNERKKKKKKAKKRN